MKKTKLLALFSTALLLVSCGGTKYTNSSETTENGKTTSVKEEFYARSDSFTYNYKSIYYFNEAKITQEGSLTGSLETTNESNIYKYTVQKKSIKYSFSGSESDVTSYKTILKLRYLAFSDEQKETIISGKKLTINIEEKDYASAYVAVDTDKMTFAGIEFDLFWLSK